MRTCSPTECGFLSFARDDEQDHTPGQRTHSGHCGVIGHAPRKLNAELDQQKVVDGGKRQDRGIEEGEQEYSKAPGGGDSRQQPIRHMVFAHKIEAAGRPISTPGTCRRRVEPGPSNKLAAKPLRRSRDSNKADGRAEAMFMCILDRRTSLL